MPIRFSKYIDIRSAIAAATILAARQFGGRIYTPNSKVSPGSVLTYSDEVQVGAFFGLDSEEYKRALFYFTYVSPTVTSPQQISFARWVQVATPVRIFGGQGKASSLATLKTVIAGQLALVVDGTQVLLTGISFSAATSLTDVASELTTAIAANANPVLGDAVVSYDAPSASFNMVGSSTQTTAGRISVAQAGSGVTDVASNVGWYVAQGAVYTNSAPAATPLQTIVGDVANNNNFGSFIFIANGGDMPTLDETVAVAQQNAAYNLQAQYYVKVDESDWPDWQQELGQIGGTGLIYGLSTLTDEYPEMMPMCVLGATRFEDINGAPGYMWTQFPLTPSVTDDTISDNLDAARVNYYGQTQENGQLVSLFQRGVLCGGATDPAAMNVYANEQWLKAFAGTSLFNLMMALKNVGANVQGRGQLIGVFTDKIIPAATNNGVISIGKTLDEEQIQFITEKTGDPNAWQQVQNIGYWYDVDFTSAVATSGIAEYRAKYVLIYSKDDLVLGIDGTHALI